MLKIAILINPDIEESELFGDFRIKGFDNIGKRRHLRIEASCLHKIKNDLEQTYYYDVYSEVVEVFDNWNQ